MTATPQGPVLQELIEHAGWIRALARGLVSDPAIAEDVAQDAWLAVLERPPEHSENLRGWIATVVRNTVRMRVRGDGRRADRETLVAQDSTEELPSASDLAERVETQRRPAARVLELEEPYQETVLLRYYEGLSSAEIARRTGVPAGTVRWRLSEGLARLRGGLDEDFDGERAAWVGLLLPLTERAALPATSAVGSAGLLTGFLTMNIAFKLILGGVLVALVLFATGLGPDL